MWSVRILEGLKFEQIVKEFRCLDHTHIVSWLHDVEQEMIEMTDENPCEVGHGRGPQKHPEGHEDEGEVPGLEAEAVEDDVSVWLSAAPDIQDHEHETRSEEVESRDVSDHLCTLKQHGEMKERTWKIRGEMKMN